jgi:hypothetical protein
MCIILSSDGIHSEQKPVAGAEREGSSVRELVTKPDGASVARRRHEATDDHHNRGQPADDEKRACHGNFPWLQ